MSTTLEELLKLIDAPTEDRSLEFKKAEQQLDRTKLFRRCVAIGNEGGGRIILGVTDARPRQVVNTQAFPNIAKIEADIFANCKIRVVVEEIQHPDGRVLVFNIPSRPVGSAFEFDGQYLMRVGEETQPMSADRLRTIFAEAKPPWEDRLASPGLSGSEVVKLLKTDTFYDLLELPYPTTQAKLLESFVNEGFLREIPGGLAITNLAAICFANNLRDFDGLRFKCQRFVIYDGLGKLATRLDRTETRGIAIDFEQRVDEIYSHLPGGEFIDSALRKERRMLPRVAIRELLANALIHQDFDQSGNHVLVELFDNRMLISSPGVPLIDTERFIDGYRSRNEKLADLMRRLGICERLSSGIDKVITGVEAAQLPAPDFRVQNDLTISILFAAKPLEEMDRGERVRACYQHCVVRFVDGLETSNKSLRDRFGLSESGVETVSRVLRDTIAAGKIKIDETRSSSTKFRYYLPFWA